MIALRSAIAEQAESASPVAPADPSPPAQHQQPQQNPTGFNDDQLNVIAFAIMQHLRFNFVPRMHELVAPITVAPTGPGIDAAAAVVERFNTRLARVQAEIDRSAAAVVTHKAAFEAAVAADDEAAMEASKRQWFAERDANEAATMERGILEKSLGHAEGDAYAAKRDQFVKDFAAMHADVWQRFRAVKEELHKRLSSPELFSLIAEYRSLVEVVDAIGHSTESLQFWMKTAGATSGKAPHLFPAGVPGLRYC